MRFDRMVMVIAGLATCAWCGWASAFHRTTVAAETTWLITLAAVVLVDVGLWRGAAGRRFGWRLRPAGEPWPRQDNGGSGPALSGVAPWLALIVVVVVWEILGIDTGPHRYHLTISALAQAYRPLNAGLLLVWVLVAIAYEVARVRAPIEINPPVPDPTRLPPHEKRGAFTMAIGSAGIHHGGAALLLPQSPPVGVAFWVAVPLAAVLVDWAARHSEGRRASAEEFVRFISTSRLANCALITAWVGVGYHLFAR